MTLKICRICREELSSEARTCPNCGALQPRAMAVDYTIILIVAIVLSITLIKTYVV